MEQTIHAQIRAEWRAFIDDKIEVVPGYSFSQYEIVKKIHLYLNSQFESAKNYMGRRKLFFNVTKYRALVATRMLNFDTKDLRLIAEDYDSSLKAFLLEKEFRLWLKSSAFAEVLNQIAENVPQFGSCVIRKLPNKVECMDLRYFACDPAVDRIQQSPYVLVKKYLTVSEVKAQKGWDERAKKMLLSRPPVLVEKPSYEDDRVYARGSGGRYYEIFERYGECPKSWLTGNPEDEQEIVRTFFVTADSYAYYQQNPNGPEMGITLFKGAWIKAWPFWDFHYYKTLGRWLGIGVVEDLFPVQERENEMSNQKRVAMEVSSLILFQTTSATVLQNLLQDTRPGDVIQTVDGHPINPVATQNKDLPAFSTEESRYDQQADRLSFAYDATRGETMGKSTPATNAVIQNNAANGVYEFKKENIGIGLRFFLLEWVLPQLVKDLDKDHILRFTGSLSELRRLDDVISESITRNELMDRLLNGRIVTDEDKREVQEQVRVSLGRRGIERFLKVVKGFYNDVKVDFDFIVTNEQKDMQVLAGNLFTVLSSIAQNPEMLKNPTVKSLMKKYAETIGIPSVELDFAEADAADIENRSAAQMDARAAGVAALVAGGGQGQPMMQQGQQSPMMMA